MLEHALKYAAQGFLVFPLYEVGDGICACMNPDCKNPGKHPRIGDGLLKASKEPTQIRSWWERWPYANIGARTGDGSGYIVLDVDDRPGKRGLDSLLELGFTPEDFSHVHRTGSGGYHIFFRTDDLTLRNRQAMKPGLDVRGSGGYVVMPPSTHASGDVYTEAWNKSPQEIPTKLLELFKAKKSAAGRPATKTDTSTDTVCTGSRDNYLLSFAGKMRRLGMVEEEIFPALEIINKRRCTPPKDEQDIQRLARNACRYSASAPITPQSATLNAFIQRAHLIVNTEDATETTMLDFTTGISKKVDRDNILAELGESGYRLFRANQEIRAYYGYNPLECRPMFQDQEGFSTYNQYVPPKWKHDAFFFGKELEPVNSLPEVYETFFQHFTANDRASFEYLIDWLATSLQGRNHTMLTAIGEQGIGKGTLALIMQKLHGKKNFAKVRDTVFKEKFNARLKNKTLVYVDEIDLKTKESQDRIKDVVNEEIEVEAKGKDADEVTNFASYYLSSNSMDAVKIEPGDRRFSVIQLTDTKLIHTPLMGRVAELMDEKNIDALARFLYFKRVETNMYVPFRSERFEMVRSAGLKDWEHYVIHEWAPQHVGREIDISLLQEAIAEDQAMRTPPGRRRIEELAQKYSDVLKIVRRGANRWVTVLPRDNNRLQ